MEITGKVIQILPTKSGVSKSGTPWAVQEFVIETQETYPKKAAIRVFGADKINQFAIKPSELLTVSLDINAREFNGNWHNDITAWKVVRGEQQQAAPQPQQQPQQQRQSVVVNSAPQPQAQAQSDGDLPF